MTYLCVPIFVTDSDKARRDIARAVEAGADMIELRIDRAADQSWLSDLQIDGTKTKFIITCRPTSEGGFSALGDLSRAEILIAYASDGHYVDLEFLAARNPPIPKPHKWIVSFHDFEGRPAKMNTILADMGKLPADVNKIVWKARSVRDNLEAFELLQNRNRPTIALCMGEGGMISRILAKKFGAFLTFASLDDTEATAPGQLTIAEMKNLYRWDAIKPTTKTFGVVAHPVRHSMSPAIHNAAFSATSYDGIYLPLLVEPSYEAFKAFMETFINFAGLDLSGLSVTIPHKQNALRYLKEKGATIEDLAARIGAVNTIAINRDKGLSLAGSNTDYAAILDSVTDKMNITRDGLRNLRVAILGAGGTGRAAVAAFAHYGATVQIQNRTHDRAQELANEFNGQTGKVFAASMEELCKSDSQVWINTTSVGMHPNVDQSPLDGVPTPFTPKTVVFDTVYNPIKTRLLEQAEAAGAATINGVEMFVRQAESQFTLWTGLKAPREVMRAVVESRLKTKP